MPRTYRDEITGDFLGLGYDQRMRAEGSSLNIYDPPAKGGDLLQQTPMDLSIVPTSVWTVEYNTRYHVVGPLANYVQPSTLSCYGCFDAINNVFHLTSIYLAVVDGDLYISGTKGNIIDGGHNQSFPPAGYTKYRNLVYRVPADGSCASETCASAVADLPTWINMPDGFRSIGVTALAAGHSGGKAYVAAGMTDGGVKILDAALNVTSTFIGMANPSQGQTPATAVAFDPAGTGYLAVGVVSDWVQNLVFKVNANGTSTGYIGYYHVLGSNNVATYPVSTAWARRADGSSIVAYGNNDGTLVLLDPTVLNGPAVASGSFPTGNGVGISAITPIPRSDGTHGGDDFAFSQQLNDSVTGGVGGQLARYDETAGTLKAQLIGADSSNQPTTLMRSRDEFRNWFPGFKEGRITVQNASTEAVTVSLKSRPQAAYGCWFAQDWADAAAFPTSDPGITVAPGASSAPYVVGGATGGAQGLCGVSDITAVWRGYLAITPVDRPADTKLVRLQLNRDTSVDISDQTTGSMNVTATRTGPGGALGTWQIRVDTPAAPAAATTPTVEASVLTTAQRGRATVYRFDVSSTQWTLPAAAKDSVTVRIPPLQVQGSTDGTSWTDLGAFMPVGSLNAGTNTDGAPTVTASGGTFFWENVAGATPYTQIRVLAGSLASTPVALSSLTPPTAPTTPVTSVTIGTKAGATTAATPAPNGVDQTRLLVQVYAGATVLPSNDPAYASVYYRDEDDQLVTNLYTPGAYADFVGIQPSAGAYPGTGLSRTARRGAPVPAYDYVSTTGDSSVKAYVGVSSSRASQPLVVDGTALDIQAPPGAEAAATFSLEGCADYSNSSTCQIASDTAARPALYQAGSPAQGPVIGVQLSYPARNANVPMEWEASKGVQNLATATLTTTSTTAAYTGTAFRPTDSIDANLVSHGQPVPVRVNVGTG